MIATAHILFDRDYFETLYDESLKYRLKWRRYAIWFATVLLLFGITMAVVFTRHWLVGGLFAAAGTYELAMAATHRRRWIKARLVTAHDDKSVQIVFHDVEMTTESPLGSSTMRYAGFEEITAGSQGFFLVPDTGVSVYVPRCALEDIEAYDRLVDLIASQTRSQNRE